MDTLNAISTTPAAQSSGLAQAPPESKGAISAAHTTAATTLQVKTSEQNGPAHKQKIANAVNEINSFFQIAQRSLGFSVDEASGHMVMQIRDTKTNELISQIPGEEALVLAKRLDDVKGVLFKAQA